MTVQRDDVLLVFELVVRAELLDNLGAVLDHRVVVEDRTIVDTEVDLDVAAQERIFLTPDLVEVVEVVEVVVDVGHEESLPP